MIVRNYNEILNSMRNYMIANQKKVTDFNQGSIIMTFFESVARIVERIYIDTRNGYNTNLRAIPYSVFDFKRKAGTYAQARVIFSRDTALSSATQINVGTVVSSGVYKYETTEIAIIPANELESNEVTVKAVDIGSAYNVAAQTINLIESTISSDVTNVINNNKAYGGADEETDIQLLSRFKAYINGLQGGTQYAIEAAVLGIDGVRSVSVEEHFPPLQGFNATIYVDDGTGNLPQELNNKVYDVVYGDGTIENPGIKATGINIDIKSPVAVNIDIHVKVTIYRVEEAKAQNELYQTLSELINSLKIGEDVLLTDIILKLRSISYVKDVAELTINGKVANEAIGLNQIARLNNVEFEWVKV